MSTTLLYANLKHDDAMLDYGKHFATLFPDGIKSDIDRGTFLLDLRTMREIGFRGKVMLGSHNDIVKEYHLNDDGIERLTGVVVREEVEIEDSAVVTAFCDGPDVARLIVNVGVDDLNAQYAWLIEQAEIHRTDFPEPLIGLMEFFEGMRDLIREVSPELCPLLDATEVRTDGG